MIDHIAVFVECKDRAVRKASLELLTKAHELCPSVYAFALGHEMGTLAQELASYADTVIVVDTPVLKDYRWDTYTEALYMLITKYTPSMVFAPSTMTGKDFFPRLSARLNAPFIADAVGIEAAEEIKIKKPLFGGRVISWATVSGTPLITFRPNTFSVEKRETSGSIIEESLTLTPDTRLTLKATPREASAKVDLQEADFIICGGRGMKGPEHFALLEEIAALMKGRVGASRAVVDNKWREYDDQIGKSGKTVSPKIYIGCGVSGALHHTMGMDTAKTIIAINKDPTAPIFEAADYGIVDDVFAVLPLLKEELIKAKKEG
jgi:electron transfer flavoprotein alpha subunit